MKKFAACLGALLLTFSSARAQQQPPTLKLTPALDTAQARELLGLFDSLCLAGFPDEAAVMAALGKANATPMAAELVRGVLGGPGRGWRLEGKSGSFVVTLKDEPDRHCAVRAASDTLFAPPDWRNLLRQAAAARKLELSGDIDYDQPHADGSVAHAFVNLLPASRMENFTMIVEEYERGGQHRVETRLMRRLFPLPAQH